MRESCLKVLNMKGQSIEGLAIVVKQRCGRKWGRVGKFNFGVQYLLQLLIGGINCLQRDLENDFVQKNLRINQKQDLNFVRVM